MQSSPSSTLSTKYDARRDLRLQLIADDDETRTYNVLDPITRQNYRIGELERTLLLLFNGHRTCGQVLKLLQNGSPYQRAKFPDVTESRFLAIVEQLRISNLIRAPRSFSSAPSSLATAQSFLSSFVVWQIRGLQPDAWLARLAPHTGAVFSGTSVRFWLLLAAMTACAVAFEFPRLMLHGPTWQWIVQPIQGSTLFIVFLITRAAHELGHALACKRHDVRCPDIGIFVILGAPCVYCDVTESWHLPSRWQRAAVAAAGMYVELIVATLAAWVWMLTIDGPVNTIALQTMFVCSVSTILINANPLMRFDGYYLLSDLIDAPNLRARADQIAVARIYRWVLGRRAVSPGKAGLTSQEHFLSLFSWSSWIYRAGLSVAIASVLAAIYASWNLAWLGRLLAVSILLSWWGVPSMKFASDIMKTARRTKTSWRLAAVTVAASIGIISVPLPYRQFARGWVQPTIMQGVYVSTAGALQECKVASGSLVKVDQPLFQLENMQIERIAAKSSGESRRAQSQLESQIQASLASPQLDFSSFEIAAKNAKQQAENARRKLERLTLLSPTAGQLIVMPVNHSTKNEESESGLARNHWDDDTQRERYLAEGTMLAAVCSPQQVAVLPLNDEQLEWIATGTEVRIRCADRLAQVYKCKVTSVVRLQEASAAWRLTHAKLSSTTSAAGGRTPAATVGVANAAYAAFVELPEGVTSPLGASVDGSFFAPSQTLAAIAYRWLHANLRWLAD